VSTSVRRYAMRILTVCVAIIGAFLQSGEPTGAAAIMESLLFGFEMVPPARTAGLPADVKRSLLRYRERERIFKPTFRNAEYLESFKYVGLERALFCLFDRPDSMQLAEDYATQTKFLSEWEGLADSPLTEAASADAFLAQHRNSSVAAYAELFAGHRKLCAVSGLQGLDPTSERARGIARDADMQLGLARDAGYPLIRIVADYLLRTRRCFER
jgi:hypothetical protein